MRDNAWPLISAESWPPQIAGYYAEQCMNVRVSDALLSADPGDFGEQSDLIGGPER
jgi:hypothetical protein